MQLGLGQAHHCLCVNHVLDGSCSDLLAVGGHDLQQDQASLDACVKALLPLWRVPMAGRDVRGKVWHAVPKRPPGQAVAEVMPCQLVRNRV